MDRHQWNERYAAQPLLWTVDPNPFLAEEVGGCPAGRALDLGAGEGRTTLWLAARGWDVTAVDFSDVALDRGRRRVEAAATPGTVDWVQADLVEYVPAGGPYDLVLFLFIHLAPPDRRRLLRAAAETLAPGGVILVAGYHTDQATRSTGFRDPAKLYTADEIAADLDGLRIERAERLEIGDDVDAVVRAVRD
jgi:SAM-dependent methyltransferase